ncbi:MAG: protein kinase domain-containing protein [Blastocatellia bacterium]
MTPEEYEQIGKFYQAALEREPAERAVFLAEVCGDDESLRREVESLLAAHEQTEDFIERTPDDVAAGWQAAERSLPAHGFSHYRMLSLLGRGGMGEVWLAEDTRLGRKVAIKLLLDEYTTDADRVRRFEQEARAASALNHPNIITIHEIGEADSTHYIVTEYVEGETLRRRMQRRMESPEMIDVASQIAAAISAAHDAGVTHRDIKPENVMLRRDGFVKVLDFGLAKLTEPPPKLDSRDSTLFKENTASGQIMGTPQYMSPEQARGEKVDARSDLFSLGVMLYEMIAGRAPFAGTTPGEMIASILRDEPAPLGECAPDAPREFESIVGKALRKDRAERYQTASELCADLKELKRRIELGTKVGGAMNVARHRRAILAGAALLIAALVGLATRPYFNPRPALTEKDTILLADFENKTGDEVFDNMLKQALAIQLQQSPFLKLFPEEQSRQTLRLMRRSPDERVTAALAREICERENIKALIAGSIAPLGGHYVITLEAINGQSGESLAREQVEAESKELALRALAQAATGLREKLGESLSSIQRFDRSFEDATTHNLEAFKLYARGDDLVVRGRMMEAIPLLRRAVELDPDFAYAWSMLSVAYIATSRPGRSAECAAKAYALRDRVSEYEKLSIANFYHGSVTGDIHKRIEILNVLKQTYPPVWSVLGVLAANYYEIGRLDQAIEQAPEAIRLNPGFGLPRLALGQALLRLNRYAEAKEVFEQAVGQRIDLTSFHASLYVIAFIEGDAAGMRRQLDWTRGKPDEYVAFGWQAGAAGFAGQRSRSAEFSHRLIDLTARGDTVEVAARAATEEALRGAVFGDCRRAKTDAARGLKLARGRASLPRAALALTLCGEANQAGPLVDELTKLYPEDTIINSIWLPAIHASVELRYGNATQALERLQAAANYEAVAQFWPQHLRGSAYLKLGRGAEAAAEFQKILDHRGYAPLSPLYPLAHLGLALAAAKAGDMMGSQKAYEDFFARWKEADPDLPILIEAKREYKAATTGSVTSGIVK